MFWSDKLGLSITYAARLPAGDSTKFGDQVSSDTKCLCILPCFLAIILSFYWYTCLIGFAHFIWWHDTGVIMPVCLRDLADVSYYGARSCLLFMCVCLIHQCHSQTPKLVTCFPIFCAAKALSNAVKQNWRISAWNGSFQNLSEFFVCTLPLAVLTWYLAKSETSRWMAGHKEDQTRPTFQVIKQCGGKNKQSAVKTMKWSRTSWRGLKLLRLVPLEWDEKCFFAPRRKQVLVSMVFAAHHFCINSVSPLYHPWATFLFWSQVGTWWWSPVTSK